MLKPVSTNTLFLMGKTRTWNSHTMLKKQPEMTEAMKINHFHGHLREEAL